MGTPITFDFGDSAALQEFSQRNRAFWPAFQRLLALTNDCFGPRPTFRNRTEDVVFHLGEACRDDFLEIAFSAAHAKAGAALKLVRGLYERAVTAEYIRQHPEKADRFLKWAGVQEFKGAKRALEVVTPEHLDTVLAVIGTSFADMKKRYEEVKSEFQMTLCDKCKTKGMAPWWDKDFTTMAGSVGEPFKKVFLLGYTIPTLQVHATPASAFGRDPLARGDSAAKHVADRYLAWAHLIYVAALNSQNELFSLGLETQINGCWADMNNIWGDPVAAQKPTAQ